MTVNEEINQVQAAIENINEQIRVKNLSRDQLETKIAKHRSDKTHNENNLHKLITVDLPYCDSYSIKAKREACQQARNTEIANTKGYIASYQAAIDNLSAQMADLDNEIQALENAKAPYMSQLNILKTKQASENAEREKLADQGISYTANLEIAEAEGDAKRKEAEIVAQANAEVIRQRGAATLDEEEEAARLKNQQQKAIMYVGIGVAVILVAVVAMVLIKKFKKKGARK